MVQLWAGTGEEDDSSFIGRTILVLYMLAGINLLFSRLKEYSCDTQELFMSSVWVRHIYNFIGVFFLLVLFTRSQPLMHPVALLGVALLICVVFVLMTRCDHRFLVTAVMALAAVFFLEAWIAYERKRVPEGDREHTKLMMKAQYVLEAVIAVLIVVGCIVYIGQHSREYRGGQWSWKTFWLGTSDHKCKQNGSGRRMSVARDVRDGIRRVLGRGGQKR